MDAYLSRYQSSDKYQDSPCFSDKGGEACKDESIKKQIDASIAQKKANDALLRGIDIQQTAMKSDAHQLIRLQEQAQSASGELQAIQAANQLASAESNQLLQIRGLMVASETAKATRAAALADKKARQEVADASFRSGTYSKSTGKTW
jgi:P-type conjugative transfer protein TrbJ